MLLSPHLAKRSWGGTPVPRLHWSNDRDWKDVLNSGVVYEVGVHHTPIPYWVWGFFYYRVNLFGERDVAVLVLAGTCMSIELGGRRSFACAPSPQPGIIHCLITLYSIRVWCVRSLSIVCSTYHALLYVLPVVWHMSAQQQHQRHTFVFCFSLFTKCLDFILLTRP